MEGFDVLGAVEFEEYIVGATIPSEKPTLTRLSRASSKANAAATKLSRLKSPRAKRAAQRLRSLASTATAKGQKLSRAVKNARLKAQSTLAKPEAKPALAAAARALVPAARPPATTAQRAATVVPRAVPMLPAAAVAASYVPPTPAAPVMPAAVVAQPAPAPVQRAVAQVAAPVRSTVSRAAIRRMSVGAIGPFQLQSITNWVGPMLDVYNAFANAMDDASVAAEVLVQVEPLYDQLSISNPSHPLVPQGYDILIKADEIIYRAEPPADPPPGAGGESVGWWVGETTYAGSSLQVEAIAWIKQARLALGQWGTPVVVTQAPDELPLVSPPVSPDMPEMPEMPLMNQTSPSSGGGGGGGGGGGEEGGYEEGAPADEAGMPEEGGEEAYAEGEEGGYEEEGFAEEGEEYAVEGEDYAYYDEGSEYATDEYETDVTEAVDPFADEYSDEHAENSEDEEATEDEEVSALEALSLIGHRGGRGGGRGHHHGGRRPQHQGYRGMYPYYGPYYAGPYYDNYGYDVFLEEDDEDLADKIAKKIAQREWIEGQHAQLGYVAPVTNWYTIATPGAMKAEMDKVLREGNTLNQDVAATSMRNFTPAFVTFNTGWQTFWAGYKKFYEDTGWFSRLVSSTGDQIVAYGNQLNDWRNKLKQFSGAVVTEPDITDVVRREDPTKFNYKPLLYGGIAVAVLAAGGYGLSHVGAIAALFGGRKRTA